MGQVYLIHFDRPIGNPDNPRGQAQHYIGYASKSLEERLKEHQEKNGSKIMAEVSRQGISWKVTRTWLGTRTDERRLKNWHKSRQLCPLCRGEKA